MNKTIIYICIILLCLFSLVLLICSIKNKNKYICKTFTVISMLYIFYLITNIILLNVFLIECGLEILLIYLLIFVAIILYIINIILNLVKSKKIEEYTPGKKYLNIIMLLIILPILIPFLNISREINLINKSDLLVVFNSNGNGGFNDYQSFAYAVDGNSCKRFDIGVSTDGYRLENYIFNDVMVILNEDKVPSYKISINEDDVLSIYKNNKKICKIEHDKYFNIEFERAIIKKN